MVPLYLGQAEAASSWAATLMIAMIAALLVPHHSSLTAPALLATSTIARPTLKLAARPAHQASLSSTDNVNSWTYTARVSTRMEHAHVAKTDSSLILVQASALRTLPTA